jgi:hypothetical protein
MSYLPPALPRSLSADDDDDDEVEVPTAVAPDVDAEAFMVTRDSWDKLQIKNV